MSDTPTPDPVTAQPDAPEYPPDSLAGEDAEPEHVLDVDSFEEIEGDEDL